MSISIRQAQYSDAQTVAKLVYALLLELAAPDATSSTTLASVQASTTQLLADKQSVWAFLAEADRNTPVGVLTLSECTTIYAGGTFGIISELYISPQARSKGVGPQLLEAATVFARKRNWKRLEVGAPSVPRWARTVAFYKNNGFVEIGPRLRLPL